MTAQASTPDIIKTTCCYCGVGCGVDVQMRDGEVQGVAGTADHPANLGRLCVKGSALHETLDTATRLLTPQIGERTCSWDEALDTVASGLNAIINKHGPNAVALYVSGQILTEDYYVANKLIKGFIGSGNIDTNSRLCMSSAVVGHKRAFGTDTVPCDYTDLEQADLLVIAGSNMAWAHPVVYQRIVEAKRLRPHMRIVTIDPRETATTDLSDLHLGLQPKSDTLLFNGLLHYLHEHGCVDQQFVEQYTNGADDALAAAAACGDIAEVAAGTGLSEQDLLTFYSWFAETEKTVTLYSQGLNQSATGSDNANSVINCHLATARIGKTGAGPFSITGQPNAMGGREVGGLANMLAAHMDFGDAAAHQRVSTFWDTDKLASEQGLKAIDLFDAVADGTVKAVWIMGTNPAVSMPQTDRVIKALQDCELVVVSDCEAHTDTTAFADVLLPALPWGEKSGTVTNSERRISRQRAFMPPTGDAKADWWIMSQVAQRMGFADAFDYTTVDQVFREHAALSAFDNNGTRDFDIGALSTLNAEDYDTLPPVQWPCPADTSGQPERLFADGRFFTPNRRANFVAITPKPLPKPSAAFPYTLNSGRLRDQWHTMTRTAKTPRLLQHTSEPYIEVSTADAEREGISEQHLLELCAENGGRYVAKAKVSDKQRLGSLFVPIHWNRQYTAAGKASALSDASADPISGQPGFKHACASLRVVTPKWHACIISRAEVNTPECLYWTRVPESGYHRIEMSGEEQLADKEAWLSALSGASGVWSKYHDKALGAFRAVCVADGQLQAVVYYTERGTLPPSTGLAALFDLELSPLTLRAALAGRAPDAMADIGPIVCACHNVGALQISDAISNHNCLTPQALGKRLACGTGCGSCLPELQAMIAATSRTG